MPTEKISVSKENYDKLEELKKKETDSFNDVISRLLEIYRLSIFAVGAQNLGDLVADIIGREKTGEKEPC